MKHSLLAHGRLTQPHEHLEQQRRSRAERQAPARKFPAEPQRDVLLFLLEHAPLERWQQNILSLVRDEASYFLQQGRTKIMNEGWATCWHSELMTKRLCKASEVIDYADHASMVTATSGGRLNPYKLGLELFRDSEERWNTGRFGKEWEECHLTRDFCVEHNLFSLGHNARNKRWEIVSREFADVKAALLSQPTNGGQPIIHVADGNLENKGELLLVHRHEGLDLDSAWSAETLAALARVWSRPASIITEREGKSVRLRHDGHEPKSFDAEARAACREGVGRRPAAVDPPPAPGERRAFALLDDAPKFGHVHDRPPGGRVLPQGRGALGGNHCGRRAPADRRLARPITGTTTRPWIARPRSAYHRRMPKHKPRSARDEALIDALFDRPPLNDADLSRRLRGIAPVALRRGMLARLREPHLYAGDAELAEAVLLRTGPGEATANLLDLLTDPAATHAGRMAAFGVLSVAAGEDLRGRLEGLAPEAVQEIMLLPYVSLLADAKAKPGLARVVTRTLLEAPPEMRRLTLDAIGQARRMVGVRAVDAYRDALTAPEIHDDEALREPILLGMVEEADADAVAVLEGVRAKTAGPAQQAIQAAIMRIATARAEGRGATLPADIHAWAGTPDGQGAVVVVVDIPNPDDSRTLVDLCLRLDQDVRSVFVLPRATPAQVAELRQELERGTGCAFTKAPVGQLVRLVDDAVARTAALGRDLPDDVRPALDLLLRIPREDLAPLPSPAAGVDADRVRRMLGRPAFGTWFLDAGDLGGSGVRAPPSDRRGTERWVRDALVTIGREPVAMRIVAMTEYMARWSVWSSEPEEAGSWSALAAGLRAEFASSPLARCMVERFLEPVRGRPAVGIGDDYAHGGLRRRLQIDFFADVEAPRGIDVARLDFAEAVRVAFTAAIAGFAGHDRPRDGALDALAVDLAKALVAHVIGRLASGRPPGGSELEDVVARVVAERGSLPPATRGDLAGAAIAGAAAFFETVCALCPVRCLIRPDDRMDDVFFSERWPADQPASRSRRRVT